MIGGARKEVSEGEGQSSDGSEDKTLDALGALREGARRTLQRNGLMLVAAIALLNLAGAFLGLNSAAGMGVGMQMATVSSNPIAAVFAGLVISLISVVVSLTAIRVFVTDETARIPDMAFKRNMGYALLNTIVGGVVFGLLVAAGLILLIIPGIYLLTALFFWMVYVAVEDQNFYEALQSSWELTKGHKWRLLGLILVIGVVNILLGAIGSVFMVAGQYTVGSVVTQVVSAFGGVFALAVQARAYMQIEQ